MNGNFTGTRHSLLAWLRERRWALLAGCAVLVAGFGALNLLSVTISYPQGLRGLYTYRSVTVGDGLLLPLWAYSLVRALGKHALSSSRGKIAATSGALIGLAGGVYTQIAWLRSATTSPNWTIPTPHSFNLAGWYHAVFLCLATAFFFGISAALWVRVRREPTLQATTRLRRPGAFGVTVPPLAFLGLLALDNAKLGQDPLTISTFAWPIALLVGQFLLAGFATHWGNLKILIMLSVASALPAVATMSVFWPGTIFRGHSIIITAAVVFAGIALSRPTSRTSLTEQSIWALMIAVCIGAPLISAADAPKATLTRLLVGLALGVSLGGIEQFTLFRLSIVPARWTVLESGLLAVGSLLLVMCSGLYLADGGEQASSSTKWIAIAGAGLTFIIVDPWLADRFAPVVAAEKRGAPDRELAQAKTTAYQTIGVTAGLALIALFSYAFAVIPPSWRVGALTASEIVELIISGAALVIVILVLYLASIRTSPPLRLICAALVAWSVGQCVLFGLQQPSGWIGVIIASFAAVIVGLFIANAIVGNMSHLHNLPFDRPVKLLAILCGTTAATTTLWLEDSASSSNGQPSSVIAAVGALLIGLVAIQFMPYLAAKSLHRRPIVAGVRGALAGGVLQDSFVSLLLAVFVIWLPLLMLTHLDDLSSWGEFMLIYSGYLTPAYLYVMRNNVYHVRDTIESARDAAAAENKNVPTDLSQALKALRAHCRRQNLLAIAALLPLVLIVLYTLSEERGGFKSLHGRPRLIKELLIP